MSIHNKGDDKKGTVSQFKQSKFHEKYMDLTGTLV